MRAPPFASRVVSVPARQPIRQGTACSITFYVRARQVLAASVFCYTGRDNRAGRWKMSEQMGQPVVATVVKPQGEGRSAWRNYWRAMNQTWRTEPEIDAERQALLAERRAVKP